MALILRKLLIRPFLSSSICRTAAIIRLEKIPYQPTNLLITLGMQQPHKNYQTFPHTD